MFGECPQTWRVRAHHDGAGFPVRPNPLDNGSRAGRPLRGRTVPLDRSRYVGTENHPYLGTCPSTVDTSNTTFPLDVLVVPETRIHRQAHMRARNGRPPQ